MLDKYGDMVRRAIKVNNKRLSSAHCPDVINDIWTYNNRRNLAVTHCIDSNVDGFMITVGCLLLLVGLIVTFICLWYVAI